MTLKQFVNRAFGLSSQIFSNQHFTFRPPATITNALHGLIHTARTGSVYVTMSVTIERYLAIVHPMKMQYLRYILQKILLSTAVTFAILYNLPKVNQEFDSSIFIGQIFNLLRD